MFRSLPMTMLAAASALVAAASSDLTQPAPTTSPAPSDEVRPAGLPPIGKWMIDPSGDIAHWLDAPYQGKALREPINVILIDRGATSIDDARRRLVAAAAAAGYPVRRGHSTGYHALIDGHLYPQLPAARDAAFSNRVYELSNNHGRIFGPNRTGEGYVFIGAFSREGVRPLHSPHHTYSSFNRARDDFSQRMNASTGFKLNGFVNLENAVVDDPKITTGDHDG